MSKAKNLPIIEKLLKQFNIKNSEDIPLLTSYSENKELVTATFTRVSLKSEKYYAVVGFKSARGISWKIYQDQYNSVIFTSN